ncbi:hypothetical protein M090_4153 [Parabacteroides distasonis str. 3776 Po2 i]|nr:hypothetical protein M090_4153 [Parabacteroides distasonis str. 3776 Po2 i]
MLFAKTGFAHAGLIIRMKKMQFLFFAVMLMFFAHNNYTFYCY